MRSDEKRRHYGRQGEFGMTAAYRPGGYDFAKADGPWLDAIVDTIAENASLLATDKDASFQNKVHLAMEAAGLSGKD